MKIDLKVLNSQATEATAGAKKMRLSDNAASMVFQLFTKNVYSNPIGTLVREIMSNCFDSHIEANVNAPAILKLSYDKETSTHYISFIDVGVGMSPERVENIYMVYFESTKRIDNTQIGGFGIGGKTPLAYKRYSGRGEGEYDNSFFVITNYNGIKYYYCIYEGTESPEVSLIHQEVTTEHNGTEVRIPVLERDITTFEREIIRQLYYFENIIFEGFDNEKITNNYQIVRGKTFWFRGKDYSDKVHVCLGRVAYPIDYNAINENPYDYQLPVAIKLEIGEIGVTASRELIDYNEATIKILKKKLKAVKDELAELLKKQYENVQTLEDYFKVKEQFGHLEMPNGESIYIADVISQKDVDYSNFKYSFMKMPNDATLFSLLFECNLYGKKESSRRYSRNGDTVFSRNYKGLTEKESKNLFYVNGEFKRKIIKQAWLKTQFERFYVISKKSLADISAMNVTNEFNVHFSSKYEADGVTPTDFMKSILELQNEYFEIIRRECSDYDAIEVPDTFILDRKREKLSAEILNSTIPVKMIERYYKNNQRVKISHLVAFKGTVIYAYKEEEQKLRAVRNIYGVLYKNANAVGTYSTWKDAGFGDEKGILFILIAQNNVKYMEYCRKAYHVNDSYWNLLHRKNDEVMKYFQTYNIVEKYRELDPLYRHKDFDLLSTKWGLRINKLNAFIKSLPQSKKDLSDIKDTLANYFDLESIECTGEQKGQMKVIEELDALARKNADVMEYINLPYNLDGKDLPKALVTILKKVMVL